MMLLKASSNALYLLLPNVSRNDFHGVYCRRPSMPLSQNMFNNAGLKPDIMDTFASVDKEGDPDVLRKFQNIIWGG